MRALTLMGIALVVVSPAQGDELRPSERWRNERWNAQWIAPADAPANAYGVFHYRKELNFATRPERFIVHVSADARYRLFVNGESVSYGPQRSDAWVWHYDTVDLAPFLRSGENAIVARVWSYG